MPLRPWIRCLGIIVMLKRLSKGVVPVFFSEADYGTICTSDLARYTAIAATSLPDTELNSYIEVGWSTPVNGQALAAAFTKVLQGGRTTSFNQLISEMIHSWATEDGQKVVPILFEEVFSKM